LLLTIKAAMELDASNPAQAIVSLEAAAPYELGAPPQLQLATMYPVYIRGEAQLAAHDGAMLPPPSFKRFSTATARTVGPCAAAWGG
jgi:hypothetical protein